MRRQISKAAAAVGMAVGITVLGGSIVGGIALASEHESGPAPAVSSTAGTSSDDDPATSEDRDDDMDDVDDHASPSASDDDDVDDHPSPSASDDDDDEDDDHGDDGPGHD